MHYPVPNSSGSPGHDPHVLLRTGRAPTRPRCCTPTDRQSYPVSLANDLSQLSIRLLTRARLGQTPAYRPGLDTHVHTRANTRHGLDRALTPVATITGHGLMLTTTATSTWGCTRVIICSHMSPKHTPHPHEPLAIGITTVCSEFLLLPCSW